jgi:hypothetical protein
VPVAALAPALARTRDSSALEAWLRVHSPGSVSLLAADWSAPNRLVSWP